MLNVFNGGKVGRLSAAANRAALSHGSVNEGCVAVSKTRFILLKCLKCSCSRMQGLHLEGYIPDKQTFYKSGQLM